MDRDGDGIGDPADDDIDGDGIANASDNCPGVVNPTQRDTDQDVDGDACDTDDDGDGILDTEDPCPKLSGVVDPSAVGCVGDEDLDNVTDAFDNCPGISNSKQMDRDADGDGDLCDTDIDGDGILNTLDNAPLDANPDQIDLDRDGLGDVADPEFCYVYDRGNPNNCLNPLDTFKVAGAAVVLTDRPEIMAGDELRLILFANRLNTAIDYSWTVAERPDSAEAAIQAPRGATSASNDSYVYDGNRAKFVPDAPGEYTIRLEGKLKGEDSAFPGGPRTATFTFPLTVRGEKAGGCVALSGETSLPSLALLVGLFLFRRRRS
jgi:hypothetical protein